MSRQRTMEKILTSEYVTIGELARLTGCRYSTLKFYTEEGMLPFEQPEQNLTRRYRREESVARVEWIRAMRESGKTVQRYVWLARLSDELLGMVDAKKIGIAQGVDISFLSEEQQQYVTVILQETGASVSNAQAAKLKEYGKSGELTLAMVRLILTEEKPKERKVTIKGDKINRYFPEDYSNDDIEGIIIELLEEWQSKR